MSKSSRAIVTGASSGIGRATVTRLVAEGWSVLAVARRSDRLAELASEAPEHIHTLTVDLCDDGAPAAVAAAAGESMGGLDLLVNNAGTCHVGEFSTQSDAAIDAMIDLNVRALIRMCRECIPALAVTRGQIINVSSIAGHLPFEYMATYCATKAAVAMFGRTLARELKGNGIRVNTISPDGTATEIFEKMGVSMDPNELIPAADMAQMIVSLTQLPASLDVGDWIVEQRLVPKI